jgi:hypothetical protein
MKLRVKSLLVAALMGAVAFVLWRVHPAQNRMIPQCFVLKYTGSYCSGCGSLRSIHFLLQGNLAQAWAMNPLTVLLLPMLTFLAFADLFSPGLNLATRIRPIYLWALLVIFILFGALRNVPIEPFVQWAPHSI